MLDVRPDQARGRLRTQRPALAFRVAAAGADPEQLLLDHVRDRTDAALEHLRLLEQGRLDGLVAVAVGQVAGDALEAQEGGALRRAAGHGCPWGPGGRDIAGKSTGRTPAWCRDGMVAGGQAVSGSGSGERPGLRRARGRTDATGSTRVVRCRDAHRGPAVPDRPGRRSADRLVYLVGVFGLSACITAIWLGMRSVMDIGGSCGSGGPYEIAVQCPPGIDLVMLLAFPLGFLSAGLMLWKGVILGGPWAGLVALAWPALFLTLGWNFIDYGVRPPGGGGPGTRLAHARASCSCSWAPYPWRPGSRLAATVPSSRACAPRPPPSSCGSCGT